MSAAEVSSAPDLQSVYETSDEDAAYFSLTSVADGGNGPIYVQGGTGLDYLLQFTSSVAECRAIQIVQSTFEFTVPMLELIDEAAGAGTATNALLHIVSDSAVASARSLAHIECANTSEVPLLLSNSVNGGVCLDLSAGDNSPLLRMYDSTAFAAIYLGAGTPESAVSGYRGSLYISADDGKWWRKTTTSASNTGWVDMSAGGVSDGDKGDVTVSSSGATWTIDAGVVTYAKMQDVSATARILGRKTAGSGDVEELTKAEAGVFVQRVVNVGVQSSASTSVAIPYDDTVPQSGEGSEAMTLAITPKSATNRLKITFDSFCLRSGQMTLALFQDSTAGALKAVPWHGPASSAMPISLAHDMVAGTTSATTFKIRFGGASGTNYIGSAGASALYSTANSMIMSIEEYVP